MGKKMFTNSRLLVNIASLTLLCFLLTPLYGLFQIQASEIDSHDLDSYDVQIQFVDEQGIGIEGVSVHLSTIADAQITDADGLVTFSVPAGSYTYSIDDADSKYEEVVCDTPIECAGETTPNKIVVTLKSVSSDNEGDTEDGDATYPVEVVVIDGEGDPLKLATVKFTLKGVGTVYETTSNETGKFDLKLPVGEYTVTLLSVDGYTNATADDIEYIQSEQTETVFFTVYTVKTYKLEAVLLTDEEKSPIKGETITLIHKNGTRYTQTSGADGKMEFKVPAGEYTYEYLAETGAYEAISNTSPIIVGDGYVNEVITICLKTASKNKINITVLDENDNFIGGYGFSFYKDGNDVALYSVITDGDGKASVEVEAGEYLIKNNKIPTGYNHAPDKILDFTEKKTYDITYNVVSSIVDNNLAHIKLRILNAEEKPQSGVELSFYKRNSERAVVIADYVEETDVNGYVDFNIEAGTYDIKITNAPFGFTYEDEYVKSLRVGGGEDKDVGLIKEGVNMYKNDPDSNQEPTLNGSGDGNGGNIDGDFGIIKISVLCEEEPLAGVEFTLTGEDNSTTTHTSTTAPLEIDKAVGDYTLKVISVPNGYVLDKDNKLVVNVAKGGTTVISVGIVKEQDTPINPPVVEKGNLKVLAVFDGRFISGIGFSLTDSNGNFVGQGVTDGNGVLNFNGLSVGNYSLRNTSVTDGYELVAVRQVTVQPNQTTDVNVVLQLKDNNNGSNNNNNNGNNNNNNNNQSNGDYASISIKLLDTSGNPISEAEFTLYSGEEEVTSQLTNSNGVVSFSKLNQGTYTLIQTGVGNSNSRTLDRRTVTVNKGDTKSFEVTVPKGRGRTISGFVFEDVDGDGVYDDKVDSLYRGAKVQLLDSDGEFLLQTKTNSDGEYKFTYVPNGDYILKLDKVRNYKFIDKRYGTNSNSSSINKRGEVEIYIEDDDLEGVKMGIISEDTPLIPVTDNSNNKNDNNNRFPTLDNDNNDGLMQGNSNQNGSFVVPPEEQDNNGLYDINDNVGINNGGNSNNSPYQDVGGVSGEDNTMSQLPKTGNNGYIGIAVLYILLMFVIMYSFRKYLFDKLVK